MGESLMQRRRVEEEGFRVVNSFRERRRRRKPFDFNFRRSTG